MDIIELILAQDNEVLESALRDGLDPNFGNKDYQNALELFQYCIWSVDDSPKFIKYEDYWQASEPAKKELNKDLLAESVLLLIKYGINVNAPMPKNEGILAHCDSFLKKLRSDARKALLDKSDLSVKDHYERTPLLSGAFDSVDFLKDYIDAGADAHAVDQGGENVLWRCEDLKCLKYAVEKLHVDFKHKTDEGRTLLHDLQDTDSLEYLIQKGCDIEQQDHEEMTPLYDSAIAGDPDRVAVFLKHGAAFSIDLISTVLSNATTGAYDFGAEVQIAERLMQQLDEDVQIIRAILADDRVLVEKALKGDPALLNYQDESGNSYLSLAMSNEKYKAATAIIDAGFDFRGSDKSVIGNVLGFLRSFLDRKGSKTSYFDKLIQASYKSEKNTEETIQIRTHLIQRLVDAGFEKSASVMAATGDLASLKKCIGSKTDLEDIEESIFPGEYSEVFLCAVGHNHIEVVKYLLELGISADSDESMDRETNALQRAVENENYEMTKLLLEKGASPALPNFAWHTPVHSALEMNNQELLDLLISFADEEDKKELIELLRPADHEKIGLS